ncbi:MAG: DNA topoisomerase-1, partial [Myxococcota bacterium]
KKLTATVTHIDNEKLSKFSINNEKQAGEISKLLENKKYQVLDVSTKEVKRRPYAPFTTSSLQQEAARKLGFSSKKTMQIAQKLYEGLDVGNGSVGLITYMRTDSVQVAPEAINEVRGCIENTYGKDYLPAQPNVFKSKVKNAQEAHEAVRPTDFSLAPSGISQYLEKDFYSLYDLIWKRMVSSQMADVIMDQATINIKTNPGYGQLRAVGSVIKFDGFYILYNEGKDDEKDEEKTILPSVSPNENLGLIEVTPKQHFTEAPPRYSEASLVKKMEELGIGRPSTYANIISVLQERGYVRLDQKRFYPEERGRVVVVFLKSFFPNYVEYDYTAKLEDDLDVVSHGNLKWKSFLKDFWVKFNGNIEEVGQKTITEVLDQLNKNISPYIFGDGEDGKDQHTCPSCAKGELGIKIGGFGVFIGCSSYPECKYTKSFSNENSGESSDPDFAKKVFEPIILGKGDNEGEEIVIKKGPYGLYLELTGSVVVPKEEVKEKAEEKKEEKEDKKTKKPTKKKVVKKPAKKKKDTKPKPKRVSIPRTIKVEDVDLVLAKKLLSLPREIGIHPETGLKIVGSIGPFGPYLLHDKKYSSVKEDDILEIGLNRSVDLIAEIQAKKAANPRASRGGFKKKKK